MTYESGGPAALHQATLLLRHRGGGGTALFADRGAKGRAPGSYAMEASPAALAKQLGPLVRSLHELLPWSLRLKCSLRSHVIGAMPA